MKKAAKRPVKARKKWVINPKTRVGKSKKVYKRTEEKERAAELYEREELET